MEYTFLDFLTLIGSVGLFLYGMKVMSEGLQKVAGDRLRNDEKSVFRNVDRNIDNSIDSKLVGFDGNGRQLCECRINDVGAIDGSHYGGECRYDSHSVAYLSFWIQGRYHNFCFAVDRFGSSFVVFE